MPENYEIPNLPGNFRLPGFFGFSKKKFSSNSNRYMFSQPDFNNYYESLLKQLPPSMKKDAWLRLTTRKNNPLSMEQARGIRSDIEALLTREVNRYYKKKDRQKIKIEVNTTSDGSNALSRLDGFEKQLKEHEYRIQ